MDHLIDGVNRLSVSNLQINESYSIIDYYNVRKKESNLVNYYNGIKEKLNVNEENINTIAEDRRFNEEILNNPDITAQEKRNAQYVLVLLTSRASNDIYEEQLSKIFGITNINTKLGWDANDEINNEPYEFKPTKLRGTNYFGSNVNINDDSYKKINNIAKYKKNYNNYEANFVIGIINENTSEFICIYKFKDQILHDSRLKNLENYHYKCKNKDHKKTPRCVYSTNIKKCIELSEKYSEKYYYWHNPNYHSLTNT